MSDAARTVSTYFSSWKAGDFDTLRSVLADDVSFVGPLGQVDDADTYKESMKRLRAGMVDLDVVKMFVDGDDVLTWFEMKLHDGTAVPVANWSHVEDGKVKRVRVTFDPRPLLS